MTQPELPVEIPPVDVVRRLGELLGGEPRLILDAGAGTGRHTHYLRGLGHTVVALGNEREELMEANQRAAAFRTPGQNLNIVGDVSRLPFRDESFDVGLVNEVLHLLPKKQMAWSALAELRRVTKPGGLNVVSGYLAMPGRANRRNMNSCLHPGELLDLYTSSEWLIEFYKEHDLPNQYIGQGAAQRELIFSRSLLIARAPR